MQTTGCMLQTGAFQSGTCSLLSHSPALRLFKSGSIQRSSLSKEHKRKYGRSKSQRSLCRALSGNPIDVRVEDKRRALLRFVQEVQPHDVLEHFQGSTPPAVADAMRTTVTNLLGALPPAYFNVTISANVEDLAQVMFSLLMTGYMYRNAQYRIDLDHVRRSYDDGDILGLIDFEALERLGRKESPPYAEGTQLTRVSGDVLRWRKDTEQLEEMNAQAYIKSCEEEIASLRDQLAKSMYARGSGNELLDFIKVQEPHQLKELTEHASTSVMEAMNSFVQRLLGNEMRQTESNSVELARMFYFLMVVGYNLRQLEVKCDFESSFTVPSIL